MNLGYIATLLLVIGGLNWGLIGFLHMDLVKTFFGCYNFVPELIYGSVGLSAVYYIMQGKVFSKH